MKNNYLSIGEMAKMNHTTISTLRLYDEMDLLKPAYVNEATNYRYYDIKQNARLDLIQYMKELQMNFYINYICLFDYLFISSQMSAKPYFIGSTGILLLW